MLKLFLVFSLLFVWGYCLESSELSEFESRAKKKKGSLKLLGMLALFVLSKFAIFKAVSVFLMMTFFQKLFALGGVLFKYFMNRQELPTFSAPQNYDTVGYSYGPPEESYHEGYPGKDVAGSFDWIMNKHV